MNCSTCWFASGGDADHCGRCNCCPPSAALAPFGWLSVPQENGRRKIARADDTALISAHTIGRMFAGQAPHMRLNGDELVIRDDFGKVVAYRIGEYVYDDGAAGFALRREHRTRYESHQWNPQDDTSECVICGVTWEDCEEECEPVCTCEGKQANVCHDIRNEPHLVSCPRWGKRVSA